ncbi:MAG: sulfotransferase [Paracoccaceae bacterium]|nr:sulfotransferase [Paracoccaceae bacterium]
MSDKKFIFAGGNARSGTTALSQALNSHPDIFMLVEQNMKEMKNQTLNHDHFTKEAMSLSESDLPRQFARYGDVAADRWDQAKYVGDKVPNFASSFDSLDETFPDAKMVFIVRNPFVVAASYDRLQKAGQWQRDVAAAVRQWNKNVRLALKRKKEGKSLVVVPYEQLYLSRENIDKLYIALGLDPSLAIEERLKRVLENGQRILSKELTFDESMPQFVAMNIAVAAYRELLTDHSILND